MTDPCPRCSIGHTGAETCLEAVYRCYVRIEGGLDIATDRIEIPIEGWPPDEPSPLDLLKEVVVLRAQVVTLEGEAGTWERGFAKGRRFGTKTALAERNGLRKQLGAALESLGKTQ
jgi:hypothetical protein